MYEPKVALDDSHIRLSMPLSKIDVERRTVHGFATLNNLDKQADIVTKEASVKAFRTFRGNIREQHDPKKAVGRVVNFLEDKYFDQDTGKYYDGIRVSAYISKGAEDTWQKVLDGTLAGFSIGGSIVKSENAYDEDVEKSIRIIHNYELTELSLVDSPANQLANIVSIEKSDDGTVSVMTPLMKGGVENVFWCHEDNLVTLKATEKETCAVCDCEMTNVGFVESNDADKRVAVKTLITEFKKGTMADQSVVDSIVKEARNMADENVVEDVEKSDAVEETPAVESDSAVEKTEQAEEKAPEAEVEKTEEVTEVEEEVAKSDPADKVDELSHVLVSSLSKLADAVEALNSRIDEMAKSIGVVEGSVADINSNVEEFGKRVDAVEDTTAFRKSGDLGEVVQEQRITKRDSLWGGAFLTTSDL